MSTCRFVCCFIIRDAAQHVLGRPYHYPPQRACSYQGTKETGPKLFAHIWGNKKFIKEADDKKKAAEKKKNERSTFVKAAIKQKAKRDRLVAKMKKAGELWALKRDAKFKESVVEHFWTVILVTLIYFGLICCEKWHTLFPLSSVSIWEPPVSFLGSYTQNETNFKFSVFDPLLFQILPNKKFFAAKMLFSVSFTCVHQKKPDQNRKSCDPSVFRFLFRYWYNHSRWIFNSINMAR